ncbi:MAG: hypothetical protein ABEJ26_05745 [Halosimplex sp.]
MSLEPIRETGAPAATREGTEPSAERPETGSVWWAELALGGACLLAVVAVALAGTSLGPFAAVTVTFGTVATLLYLAVTAALGLSFLHSGLQRLP